MNNRLTNLQTDNSFKKIKEKYPTITNNLRIHYWPTKNFVFGDQPIENKIYTFEKKNMVELNESGLKLLRMCDGTTSTNDIVKKISKKENIKVDIIKEKILKFFEVSEKKYNHIQFNNVKSPQKIKYEETGTRQYHLPVHFVLELTNGCNFNCKHCYRLEESYKTNELRFDLVVNIIDQMYKNGCRNVEITGGEFTLHKNFLDIIEYLYDKMDVIGLLTNGYTLNKKTIDELDTYKDKLLWSVSLDSFDSNYHDTFRGVKGAHKKTSENIKILRRNGHFVKVSMSVTDHNLDHVKGTMDMAYKELSVNHFGFASVIPVGRGTKIDHIFSVSEKIKKLNDIKDYSKRYPGFTLWYSNEELELMRKRMRNCGAGWKTVTIGPDGNIRPCVMMEEGTFTIGNVEKQSIQEIMKKEIIADFCKIQMPNDEDCGSCFNISFCKYCFYRGFLTNIERIKQGVEICNWGVKHGIEKLIKNFQMPEYCPSKHCNL